MPKLSLADGRVLDYHDAGGRGAVLLYHHGTPGSVTPLTAFVEAAERAGLRLVSYSRAGYGASDRNPGRSVVDVVDDVRQLLDHLDVERCVSAGWSGGGPHALATAAVLPDRVAAVASLAGVAPYGVDGLDFLAGMGEQNIEEFGAALEGEPALRTYLEPEGAAMAQTDGPGIVTGMASLLPDVDRAELSDSFGADLAAQFREGLRNGVDGWLDDDLAFISPWGFDLDAVRVPSYVWQGDLDLMVPFAHGEWLAAHLPGTRPHLLAGEGHLSITLGATDQIFGLLADALT
ncbi:alpha/beta hydrolase [Nocardioides mangrovicus]|uniref:Alpha/beta hydrolase n=1 Tax=Nocardioides mangrovicus TaxID=2478913 RepID=A0A3L8P338_9ACTN|nr:alpha/beta hydrolase [Nocardioides mangrovicus]RLV49263.1 alpha/beta hydrolase [Nocardioides mangrovicus]